MNAFSLLNGKSTSVIFMSRISDFDQWVTLLLVSPNQVPEHDLLTAGFPCQPFSKAGDQRGFECTEQGNLFFNVAAVLKRKKPTYFILENVPNLLKHDEGRTWTEIQQILGKGGRGLGYDIRAERFSPHNFGSHKFVNDST